MGRVEVDGRVTHVEVAVMPLFLLTIVRVAAMAATILIKDMDAGYLIGYTFAIGVHLAALWWLTIWL